MLTTSVCADNESDLEDFYPSDPMISAALARAITDSEDEGGTSSMSLTPRLSKEPSVVNSDDGTYCFIMLQRKRYIQFGCVRYRQYRRQSLNKIISGKLIFTLFHQGI